MDDSLGGLLTPDLIDQFRRFQSVLQPSEQDREAARKQAALLAGLAALGARKGNLAQDLSRAAMGGVMDYNNQLAAIPQQWMQQFGAAAKAMQFAQQAQQVAQRNRVMQDIITGSPPPQGTVVPTAVVSPRTAAQFGPGGGDTVGFAPLPPAPMTAPVGTQPQDVAGYAAPNWRQEMSKDALKLLAAGADPKTFAEEIRRYSETKMGPDGTVTTLTGRPLYKAVPGGMILWDGQGNQRFLAQPDAATRAEAEKAGAVKGAETAAIEAAKYPYTIAEATGPSGQQIKGLAPSLFGFPQLPGQAAPPKQGGVTYAPTLSQKDLAAAQADYAQNGNAPTWGGVAPGLPSLGGGVISGPDPLSQRAVQMAQDVQKSGITESNADWIKNSYRPTMDAAKIARTSNASLQFLDRLPISERTGWGTQAMATAASVLSGIGLAPDKVKEYAANAEMFNQAVFEHNWQLLQQQKGVQTEGDAKRALKVFVQLGNRPEANQYISDFAKAQNNIAVKKAQFYANEFNPQKQSANYARIEQEWAQRQPSIWDDPVMKKWNEYGGAAWSPRTTGGWGYIGPKQ